MLELRIGFLGGKWPMDQWSRCSGLVVAQGGPWGREAVPGDSQALDAEAVGLRVAVAGPAHPQVAAVGAVVVGSATHITYLSHRISNGVDYFSYPCGLFGEEGKGKEKEWIGVCDIWLECLGRYVVRM